MQGDGSSQPCLLLCHLPTVLVRDVTEMKAGVASPGLAHGSHCTAVMERVLNITQTRFGSSSPTSWRMW